MGRESVRKGGIKSALDREYRPATSAEKVAWLIHCSDVVG